MAAYVTPAVRAVIRRAYLPDILELRKGKHESSSETNRNARTRGSAVPAHRAGIAGRDVALDPLLVIPTSEEPGRTMGTTGDEPTILDALFAHCAAFRSTASNTAQCRKTVADRTSGPSAAAGDTGVGQVTALVS